MRAADATNADTAVSQPAIPPTIRSSYFPSRASGRSLETGVEDDFDLQGILVPWIDPVLPRQKG